MSALPRPTVDDAFLHWRSIDGAKFLLADSPRPESCGVHAHELVRVSFLLKGRIIEIDAPGKAVDCQSMALHCTPPQMRHAHLIQSPRLTTLCFDLEPRLLA